MMCFGAPLLAGWVGGFDRRRLLAAVAALVRGRPRAVRADAELRRAAGRCARSRCSAPPCSRRRPPRRSACMAPPEQRGRAITFIFLGWSVASVLGMPLARWHRRDLRLAHAPSSRSRVLGGVGRGLGLRASCPTACARPRCRCAPGSEVLTHPVLMAMVLVTALSGAGQFTLFSYFAPYYRQVLGASAERDQPRCSSWFGAVRPDRQRAAVALRSTASAPTRAVDVRAGADRACRCCCGRSATSVLRDRRWSWCRGRSAASRRNSAQQARLGARGAGARAGADGAQHARRSTSARPPARRRRLADRARRLRRRCSWVGARAGSSRRSRSASGPDAAQPSLAPRMSGATPTRCRRRADRAAPRSTARAVLRASTGSRCRASAACCRSRSASWSSASAG